MVPPRLRISRPSAALDAMAEFVLTRSAREDLDELWTFVAAANIDAANRLLTEIEAAIQHLTEMPRLGHRRPDLTVEDVRLWPVASHLIVYREVDPLLIVRVLSRYRDIASILAERA